MMSTVQEIAFSFSSSAERQHQFQEKLKETPASQVQNGKTSEAANTLRDSLGCNDDHADALCTFKLSFDVILKALEVLHNMQDSKARRFIKQTSPG